MSSGETPVRRPRRTLLALLPLALFLGLCGIFLAQLLSGRDLSNVPSALIGSPAPQTDLPTIDGVDRPGLVSASFPGRVTLVNVWASWCAPCREEHPVLMELGKDSRFALTGINYKDSAANARAFLGDLGNPFIAIGADANGRTAIDWGVYGVPETYLVGRDGKILFRHVGPLDGQSVQTELMPEIEKALASK